MFWSHLSFVVFNLFCPSLFSFISSIDDLSSVANCTCPSLHKLFIHTLFPLFYPHVNNFGSVNGHLLHRQTSPDHGSHQQQPTKSTTSIRLTSNGSSMTSFIQQLRRPAAAEPRLRDRQVPRHFLHHTRSSLAARRPANIDLHATKARRRSPAALGSTALDGFVRHRRTLLTIRLKIETVLVRTIEQPR